MKKIKFIIYILGATLISSCGVNQSMVLNHNQNNTQVVLSENNYRIVDKVSGSASVCYVLMIGGLNKRQLFENAHSAMMAKANLQNASKALVNIVSEEHVGGVPPFFTKRTVTVSANVVEFTR